MSVSAKKEEVIAALSTTNDDALINEVYHLLHPENAVEQISIDKLSQPLQDKIKKAIDDYQSGRYITHEEMKQKVAQWLTK